MGCDTDSIEEKTSKARVQNNENSCEEDQKEENQEILNINKNKSVKRSNFKGIEIVQNLEDYFPDDITKKEIDDMVFNALSGSIVKDESELIPGENLTEEQAKKISDIVYHKIQKGKKGNNYPGADNKIEDNSILNQLKVKIGMADLNRKTVKKLFFKGKIVSDIELEVTLNNLTQGNENVKALMIELIK